jgi:hypothetical protein
LGRAQSDILFVSHQSERLYYATSNAVLYRRSTRSQASPIEYQIPFGIGSGHNMLIYVTLPYFALTSPSDDAFHVFSMKSTLVHVMSVRQQFSSVKALLSAGRLLIVLNGDASLAAWDLDRTNHQSPLYRVSYHIERAVDAAASECLQMVVCCDISGKIAVVDLYYGTLMRSFNLTPRGLKPVKIMVVDEGYFVILCEERLHNEVKSTIQIYGLNTELQGSYAYEKEVTAWCGINRVGKSPMIAVGFVDGVFGLIDVPEGGLITKLTFPAQIVAMSYDVRSNFLYFGRSDRQIAYTAIDF